jgi:hypothetical protein
MFACSGGSPEITTILLENPNLNINSYDDVSCVFFSFLLLFPRLIVSLLCCSVIVTLPLSL